ncbi:MAG: ribosome maturation factor RimM [Rhizobiaceae bacterium]|nr:ribosome maturation factor RimM [Rhizobiaceae bacterium]
MTNLENPVLMATIGAPHGVKGEVRVKSFTDDPLALGDYGALFDKDGNKFTISNSRPAKNVIVVRFKEVATREAAEALNGCELFIERDALPKVDDDDEFYLSDLIGMKAQDSDGNIIGMVRDVPNFGAEDLLEITPVNAEGRSSGQTYYLPFTKKVVPKIDIKLGVVTILPPEEVIVEKEEK